MPCPEEKFLEASSGWWVECEANVCTQSLLAQSGIALLICWDNFPDGTRENEGPKHQCGHDP